ncbi:hypothetical protein ERJ75_001174300 [Trypanosoma vivax]|nr:hypothetical protein ERJ75_001174300 [Trypanosoma vivax]
MALHFGLALLAAVLLNGAVLGDDSTSGGALAGPDGERNAPSRGGDAGRKSEGRARNGDKLVVLDSARTTPSETVRKSVSVVKRVSGQSSLSSRNEARNDHAGVGNELRDQPATSHKAQASADDKHGMKLPRARRPAASRHSEGGLTSTSPKESVEVLDRKKEFENMVNSIIAEEAQDPTVDGGGYPGGTNGQNYGSNYGYDPFAGRGEQNPVVSTGGSGQPGAGVLSGDGSPVNNTLTSESTSSSSAGAASRSDSVQSPRTGYGDKDNTNDGNVPKDEQNRKREEEKEKKNKEEDGKKKEEKQLDQNSNENSDGRKTNNSSEDTENSEAPSSGNSAFLCGSCSSVLLVALVCLCACAC